MDCAFKKSFMHLQCIFSFSFAILFLTYQYNTTYRFCTTNFYFLSLPSPPPLPSLCSGYPSRGDHIFKRSHFLEQSPSFKREKNATSVEELSLREKAPLPKTVTPLKELSSFTKCDLLGRAAESCPALAAS